MAKFNPETRALLKYDIYNPNLDLYLENLIDNMSEEQRKQIPIELIRKCFKKGKPNVSALRFGEAAYLASAIFEIPVYVVFGGTNKEVSVLSENILKKAHKVYAEKASLGGVSEDLHTLAGFVVGDKNVMEALAMVRLASCTDFYKQVIPIIKRKPKATVTRFEEHRSAYRKMVKLMVSYESKKRKIFLDFGFSQPEWYALLFFFDNEKKGFAFYGETFKFAIASSVTNMRKALSSLVKKGILSTRGGSKRRTYILTSKGEKAMMEIFEKVIMDY
jgi:hypothetical protein